MLEETRPLMKLMNTAQHQFREPVSAALNLCNLVLDGYEGEVNPAVMQDMTEIQALLTSVQENIETAFKVISAELEETDPVTRDLLIQLLQRVSTAVDNCK